MLIPKSKSSVGGGGRLNYVYMSYHYKLEIIENINKYTGLFSIICFR